MLARLRQTHKREVFPRIWHSNTALVTDAQLRRLCFAFGPTGVMQGRHNRDPVQLWGRQWNGEQDFGEVLSGVHHESRAAVATDR
jgi:hypothetical protein